MKEPKILRLINPNMKKCSVVILGKSYDFDLKHREVIIPDEADVEQFLKTRNFVCGQLDDKTALSWYRKGNYAESKPELTEEEMVEKLKELGYVAYKKK